MCSYNLQIPDERGGLREATVRLHSFYKKLEKHPENLIFLDLASQELKSDLLSAGTNYDKFRSILVNAVQVAIRGFHAKPDSLQRHFQQWNPFLNLPRNDTGPCGTYSIPFFYKQVGIPKKVLKSFENPQHCNSTAKKRMPPAATLLSDCGKERHCHVDIVVPNGLMFAFGESSRSKDKLELKSLYVPRMYLGTKDPPGKEIPRTLNVARAFLKNPDESGPLIFNRTVFLQMNDYMLNSDGKFTVSKAATYGDSSTKIKSQFDLKACQHLMDRPIKFQELEASVAAIANEESR